MLDISDIEIINKLMEEKMEEPKMDEEYKYTLSFINNQPGLVIRGDHTLQLENAIAAIVPVFKKFKNALIAAEKKQELAVAQTPPLPTEPRVVPVTDTLQATCEIHKTKMFKGTSKTKVDEFGQPKTYWYHRNTEGKMCFGKGYQ